MLLLGSYLLFFVVILIEALGKMCFPNFPKNNSPATYVADIDGVRNSIRSQRNVNVVHFFFIYALKGQINCEKCNLIWILFCFASHSVKMSKRTKLENQTETSTRVYCCVFFVECSCAYGFAAICGRHESIVCFWDSDKHQFETAANKENGLRSCEHAIFVTTIAQTARESARVVAFCHFAANAAHRTDQRRLKHRKRNIK